MLRTYTDLVPTFPDRADWTLARILDTHADSTPDAVYLIAPEEGLRMTYGQVRSDARCVAAGMYDRGAVAGDRVLIMAINSSEFVRTWLGTGISGLVEVPINTAYEGEFLRHQVNVTTPKFAVIDDQFADRFIQLRDDFASIEHFWIIDKGNAAEAIARLTAAGWGASLWSELLAVAPRPFPVPQAQDLASIFFTSGTTGPSKGVAMPHAQMYFFADEVVSLTRLTNADTYMTVTPLFHGNAQFMAAYPALVAGAALVIRSKFSASRWVDQVREEGVTVTNFIGVMMDFIWKQEPRLDDTDNPVRCVFAAPTASSILEPFRKRYDIEAFVEVFGLTETSAPIISPYGEDRPAGAAGLAASDFFDIRLVNPDTDQEVAVGEIGELVVRPKFPWTCSLGYYGMPDRTAEAWRNLWFHTGDALRQDSDGWYYFVDRYKDALRRRGENISSYEVEQAVLAHPAVTECAVIAVAADVEAGEDEVMAVIVTNQETNPTEIWDYCKGRIPEFAIPRFIRIVDSLPRTPSEKIQKSVLREAGITDTTHDRTKS
jgi:crotonobetaine/carnitine-CoA ligase